MILRLLPTSEGGRYSNWTLGAGASRLAAIQADDGDTSYITSSGVAGEYHSAAFDALPSHIVSVNSIQIGAVLKRISGGTVGAVGMYPGSVADFWTSIPTVATAYTLYQDSNRAVNPATSNPWSISEANAVQAQVNNDNSSGSTVRCTMLFSDVDVLIHESGFACLVGGLVGAALGLAEMSGLARALYRRAGALITPEEYVSAWRDIRAHRYPVTFLLGGAR